jgi:glycosyltransferase involved in cell wall biosynthesis
MQYEGAMVIPCYNEETRFPYHLWNEIILAKENWQWYFVDDGSTDYTYQVLEALTTHSNVEILHLKQNVGKAEAVRFGMMQAIQNQSSLNWIGYIDSDGAFSNSDISRLLGLVSEEKFKSYQALLGSRVKLAGREIDRDFKRHIAGRILATIIGMAWKGSPYDMQSGFKIFSNSKNFQNTIRKPFHSKWFVDLEILTRLSKGNFFNTQFWEEPLLFWREIGSSKLSFFQLIRLAKDFIYLLLFQRGNKWI